MNATIQLEQQMHHILGLALDDTKREKCSTYEGSLSQGSVCPFCLKMHLLEDIHNPWLEH